MGNGWIGLWVMTVTVLDEERLMDGMVDDFLAW